MFPKVPPTKLPGEPHFGWGSKTGDEEDKKKLREIISRELKKPENRGNLDFFSYILVIIFYLKVWTRISLKP